MLANELSKQSPQVRTNGAESTVHGVEEAVQGKEEKATRKESLIPGGRVVETDPWSAQESTRHGAWHRHGGVFGVQAAGNRVKELIAKVAEVIDGVALEILEVGGQRRRVVDVGAGAVVADGAGVLELDAV